VSDLLAPQDRVKQNEQLVRALATIVKQNFVIRVSGREYLTVAGAQAIASGMGLTTTTEQLRHVPATDGMTGYWEATSTVVDHRGVVLGRGVGCVFDDEKPWNTRPQFARQMMAQTRATGRALKGVMGWATALLGAEASLAEEMPADGPTMPQEASEAPRRLPSPLKAPSAPKGQEGGLRRVRSVLAAIQAKESKAGKPYYRVGLEAQDGVTEWFTSFEEVSISPGVLVEVTLKPYRDGEVVADVVAVTSDEEVPF
jgi:hypothetical protein